MRLSTKGRYGARLMLDLAVFAGQGPQPLKEISRRTGVSVKYLEQIVSKLVNAGLVASCRGQGGGYSLGRPAGEIRLSTVLTVLEGSLTPVFCADDPGLCPQADLCVTREIWQELGRSMQTTLDAISLSDMVVRRQRLQAGTDGVMYHI